MKITKEPFDKVAYDAAYQRKHYSKVTAVFKKDEAERLAVAAAKAGQSKSEYIRQAVFTRMKREEKLMCSAIYKVMSMETTNAVTKETLIKAVKYLFDKMYDVKSELR